MVTPHQPFPGQRWQVNLLGSVSARHGDLLLTKFPAAVATLLARLVLEPCEHGRDELADLLWPDADDDPDAVRNRLRNTLAVLRKMLEPPGVLAGSVVITHGRKRIRLNPDAYVCDAVEFERHARSGDVSAARALYRGELLPGHAGAWVEKRRRALAEVYARLGKAAEPQQPPPPATHRPLVAYPTAFFGREAERERLAHAVHAHRLVSVTGFGGCGKTRLCVEAATPLDGFEEKFFVPLAECADASQVAGCLRAALGLQSAAPDAALKQVIGRLAGVRALLVLDNLEHLDAPAAEALLLKLLECLAQVHLLVTSRSVLRTAGAHQIALGPLPLPAAQADAEQALRCAAVALFADRARLARADFHIHPGNVADVVEACTALDGMPALIELGAARMGEFSARGLCDSLRAGRLLTARKGTRATRAGRHASHAAVVEWSWCLLAPREQQVLAAAAVLRAGWTVADLEAVSECSDAAAALDELLRLSFVHVADGEDLPVRHQMYTSVRQPLLQRLGDAESAVLRGRHWRRFVARAAQLLEERAWPHELDLANFHEAVAAGPAQVDIDGALTLALALREYWFSNGAPSGVLEALWRVVQRPIVGTRDEAVLAATLARLFVLAGQVPRAWECVTLAQTSAEKLTVAEAAGASAARCEAALAAAHAHWLAGRVGAAALPLAQAALRDARGSREPALQARALLALGGVTYGHLKDPAMAAGLFEESASLFIEANDLGGALDALPGRVTCLMAERRFDAAIERAVEGEISAIHARKLVVRLLLLNRIGESYASSRRFEEALAANQRLVRLAHTQGIVYHVAFGLWNQAHPLARLRRPQDAARLVAFSERYWAEHLGALDASDRRYIERVRRLVVVQIGANAWRAHWSQGWSLSSRDGIRLGGG